MRRTATAAVIVCASLLTASLAAPAFGGPSIASVAKSAKKALQGSKSATRTARAAKRSATAAQQTAASANGKADQALARPATANGITVVESGTSFISPGNAGSAKATCPAGQRAVSGGGTMLSGAGDGLASNRATTTRDAWFAVALNNAGITAEISAVAYCAPADGAVAARSSDAEIEAIVRRLERNAG